MYYVYAESVILINFCINLILLYILAKINKRKFLILRSIAAALIGAAYALLFVLQINVFTYPEIKIFIALLMVFVACKKLNIKTFLLLSAEYFLLAFICAGAVMALSNIFKTKIQSMGGVIVSGDVTLNKLITAISAAAVVIILVVEIYRNRHFYLQAEIDIKFGDKTCGVFGFADTGNLLKSITGKSVILVYKEPIKNYMSSYLNCDIDEIEDDITKIDDASKITIIACNTPAGRKNILCVKPSGIIIKCDGVIHDVSGDALIGIVDDPIAGPDKSTNAIFNPIILTKGNVCASE